MKKFIQAAAASFLGVAIFANEFQIVKNTSSSISEKYLLQVKRLKARKGDFTFVQHPKGPRIIKRIIGQEGDEIKFDGAKNLWVAGKNIGKVTLKTAIKPGVIPKGFVFLYADHEQSFDSRYADLGLVHVDALQGRGLVIC